MKSYKKLNLMLGWVAFLVAFITYTLTVEPTASLWDCGEYIATGYKLQVGHPPGAPTFMMLERLVSFFVDEDQVAFMCNMLSVLSSALTICFLFWSITHMSKKFATKDGVFDESKTWAVLMSGLIGALGYTFTDSFWFSAVEAEVYAMASFFTAIIFWAILKWEEKVDTDPAADKWILLIVFLIGLSIGVHLLNLLAIPAMVFVYYFKKYKEFTWKGFIIAGVIGILILGIIQGVVIPGTISLASSYEIFTANSLGMGFGTGTFLFFFFLVLVIFGTIFAAQKNKKSLVYGLVGGFALFSLIALEAMDSSIDGKAWFLAIVLVGAVFATLFYKEEGWRHRMFLLSMSSFLFLMGYSTFAMLVVRSNANPPIDENDPSNLASLESYLRREQYGDFPIFSGQYYTAELVDFEDGRPIYLRRFVVKDRKGAEIKGFVKEEHAVEYAKKKGFKADKIEEKYYLNEYSRKAVYNKELTGFFPRMYSSDAKHRDGYLSWSGSDESNLVTVQTARGKKRVPRPTFSDNFRYFLSYQVGFMYFRYFFWNFSGRQNDIQGHGGGEHGNWITGIDFIDSKKIGDASLQPEVLKNNDGYNKFYMLPFILGIIGLVFQYMRSPKDAWIVTLLFLFTGLAIVMYLNQKPLEPRERDYAYAASFYAFAFWIGMGLYGLFDMDKATFKNMGITFGAIFGTGIFASLFSPFFGLALAYAGAAGAALCAIAFALNNMKKPTVQLGYAVVISALVPTLLGTQGWNDHSRANKYFAREIAKNYMKSCLPQGILFTFGDNDTFPIWYLQEVEGYGTDVRNCNMSLFQTDWYANQMKKKAYESNPLPISFEEYHYKQGGDLDYVRLDPYSYEKQLKLKLQFNQDKVGDAYRKLVIGLKGVLDTSRVANVQPEFAQVVVDHLTNARPNEYMDLVTETKTAFKNLYANEQQVVQQINNARRGGNEALAQQLSAKSVGSGALQGIDNVLRESLGEIDYLPLKYFTTILSDDKYLTNIKGNSFYQLPSSGFIVSVPEADKLIEWGIITESQRELVKSKFRIKLPGALYKNDVLLLNIIEQNGWERGLYASSMGDSKVFRAFRDYMWNNGSIYMLRPVKNNTQNITMDVDKTEDLLFNQYEYGNLAGKNIEHDVFVDYYSWRTLMGYRQSVLQVANYHVINYDLAERAQDEAKKNASAERLQNVIDQYMLMFKPNKFLYGEAGEDALMSFAVAIGDYERATLLFNELDKAQRAAMKYAASMPDVSTKSVYDKFEKAYSVAQNAVNPRVSDEEFRKLGMNLLEQISADLNSAMMNADGKGAGRLMELKQQVDGAIERLIQLEQFKAGEVQ